MRRFNSSSLSLFFLKKRDDDEISDDEFGHNFATVCIVWAGGWALAEYMNATMIMITMPMTMTMTLKKMRRRMIVMMMIKF